MSSSPRTAATTPAEPPPMATEAISSSSLWSDGLPPELAGLVLCRLPSFADRVRFGAVCRHWSLAAQQQAPTLPPALPWISGYFPDQAFVAACRLHCLATQRQAPALPWISSFPRQVFQSFPDGESHSLGTSSQPDPNMICCGLSDNWLLLMSSVQQVKNLLKNPLSGATIRLPDNFRSGHAFDRDLLFIQKFIVCSDDGLTVAMARTRIGGPHEHGPLTACCRPGMSSWSTADNPEYKDIAFHRESIYGVTRNGDLYKHDISQDSGTRELVVSSAKQVIMSSDTRFALTMKQVFLVVSRGNLLLVKRTDTMTRYGRTYAPSAFDVFKADLEMSRWSEVSSLGDQVLFVSGMCSKAVSASSHGGNYLCGDRIYSIFYPKTYPDPNTHLRIWATISEVYDLRDKISHRTLIPQCYSHVPAWFFPHK